MVRPMMEAESVTEGASYACTKISVENRDYHYLSQSATMGALEEVLWAPQRTPKLAKELPDGIDLRADAMGERTSFGV
jgi:hypothetical protein